MTGISTHCEKEHCEYTELTKPRCLVGSELPVTERASSAGLTIRWWRQLRGEWILRDVSREPCFTTMA